MCTEVGNKLRNLLAEAGFDAFVEATCTPYYAARMGAPSLPPGRYFCIRTAGYFEGIDSERGIVWRCSDSYSLRDFLRLANRDKVPDHSWLSKTRSLLPHEVHEKVFGWLLNLVADRGVFMVTGSIVDMLKQSKAFINAAKRTRVKHIVHLGAPGDDDTKAEGLPRFRLARRTARWRVSASVVSDDKAAPFERFIQSSLGVEARFARGRRMGRC
jgi:hypothetical protein